MCVAGESVWCVRVFCHITDLVDSLLTLFPSVTCLSDDLEIVALVGR